MPSSRSGQAFLALVFLIGGIIVIVGITLAIIILSALNGNYGLQASQVAEATAGAGVQDALLQLERGACTSGCTYTVSSGNNSANVVITIGSPSTGENTIVSTATVSGRTRKISTIVADDATTGQITVISRQDVP